MFVPLRNVASCSLRPCRVAASSRRWASTKPEETYYRYKQWLESEGLKFKNPERPRNWIADGVPFPLNPTFKPPPPVSDELKSLLYEMYMDNPSTNNVRQLASLHGLSIKRVDAILRLKGLEEHWKKNKTLQTGFQAGMEEILGSKTTSVAIVADALGEDSSAADVQADESGNDAARTRYQRMFWEPTAEHKAPIVPDLLDSVRERAVKHQAKLHPAARPEQIHVLEREGRANIEFIDVGDQFVDKKAEQRRMKIAERRSQLRARRHARKMEELQATKVAQTA